MLNYARDIPNYARKRHGKMEGTSAGGMLRGTATVSLYIKHPAKT